jgi:hypothetical protein
LGKVEKRTVASIGTEFSRQQADKCKLGPLPNAEALKQLLPRVFEGKRNRVGGSNGQRTPLAANGLSSKVLRIALWIKLNRRRRASSTKGTRWQVRRMGTS